MRRPLSLRQREIFQQIGLAIMLFIMVLSRSTTSIRWSSAASRRCSSSCLRAGMSLTEQIATSPRLGLYLGRFRPGPIR